MLKAFPSRQFQGRAVFLFLRVEVETFDNDSPQSTHLENSVPGDSAKDLASPFIQTCHWGRQAGLLTDQDSRGQQSV
jgi:hypothetical protein